MQLKDDVVMWFTVVVCLTISGAFAWASAADTHMRLEVMNARIERIENERNTGIQAVREAVRTELQREATWKQIPVGVAGPYIR